MPAQKKLVETEFSKTISAELRAERARSNITFDELAESSGISIAQLYRFIGGQRSPSLDALDRLCKGLGVDTFTLVADAQTRMYRAELDRQ